MCSSDLNKFGGEVSELLPEPEKRFNAYIKFDGPMPVGVFERIVGEFVAKSGNFEGSKAPRLFKNYADVAFGQDLICLVVDRSAKTIHIAVEDDEVHHMRRVITFTSEAVQRFTDDILGEPFKPEILVEGKDEQRSRCNVYELWQAIQHKREKVLAITAKGRRKGVPLEHFLPFYPEAVSITGLMEQTSNPVPPNYKYHAFLCHEWGTEQSKYQTHWQVVEIGKELRGQKLEIWIDHDCLKDNVAKSIVDGLRQSRKIVVFLTRRYLERVDDCNTNASKEFTSGMMKGVENVVVVVLDNMR